MRLVTYESELGARAGVLTEDGVVDAWNVLGEAGGSSLRELLAADRVPALEVELEGGHPEPVPDAELLPPIPDPEKIVCIGLNYHEHAAEAGT